VTDEVNQHPLERIVADQVRLIKEFETRYPDVYLLTSTAGKLVWATVGEAAQITGLDEAEVCRLLLWQMIGKYQFDSLLMIVTGDLDAAYATLRNATELVRDVASIGNDVSMAQRWWASKRNDKRDKLFRFDDSVSNQKYVHQLYKMASNWGTHGHITGLSHTEQIGVAGRENNVGLLRVGPKGIEETLAVWLCGFFPMQFICFEPFAKRHPDRFRELGTMLMNHADLVGKAVKRLRGQEAADLTRSSR